MKLERGVVNPGRFENFFFLISTLYLSLAENISKLIFPDFICDETLGVKFVEIQ